MASSVLEELLVSVGIDTGELTAGADQAAGDVEQSLGGIQTAAAGAAVGGLFMTGLNAAMDLQTAQTTLENQLGLTEEQAARAGDAAGRVYSSGFGEAMPEVSEAVGAVMANISGMRDASGKDLDQMTKSAMTLAQTFEFDVGDSTQAVGNLIKTGMVKDGTEGFDLLTAAAQQLPTKLREELPEAVSQYGEFFDQLGFTGPQMMGVLAQAAKDPTFQIDKLGDAFKEFTLRLADTKAVKQPLADLGLDVEHIQMLVNTGHGTKAFDEVTAALKDVDDQTRRTNLQAALFGGPGEDMGNTLLNLQASGAAAAGGMDDAAGAAKKATDNVQASKSMDAIWRTIATTIGEVLQPALQFLADFMEDHPMAVKFFAGVLLVLAIAIGAAAAAQWLWNAALWAWPGTWIILGIMALILVILLIIVYWDQIKAATLAAWEGIKAGLSAAWEWIKTTAVAVWEWIKATVGAAWDWVSTKTSGVWATIKGALNTAWNWIKDRVSDGVNAVKSVINTLSQIPGKVKGWFDRIVDFVTGLPGRIRRAAGGLWDVISSSFRSAVNKVISIWNNLSFTIGGGSIMGVDIPSLTLSTPNIPYLAEGGITTGPTLAMIGEGRENEAVLPLSKLEGMLNSVARPVRDTGPSDVQAQILRIELVGPEDMKRLIRRITQTNGRGGDAGSVFST